ncbi:MAG: alpha/beta hydrolase-fold protein, partial [Chloroflexota bacterium]|nr:alpha/beta hydrolase-fold protein [Chloroflexota bacterium]
MSEWVAYPTGQGHTVVGDLRLWRSFTSPQLGNARDVLVWLPPDYETSERRYPVIYMHDGQNLFDNATSYAGEWQADETMTALSSEGLAA